MFGLNPRAVQEIDEALAKPDCSVDDLLKCPGVTSQFRNGNPNLVMFLLTEKNAKRIFEIIRTNPNRATQKALLALFQTSNKSLHRLFADNLIITEYAVNILEYPSEHGNFGVGIISRVISRAFDLWPDDMSEVFRISKTIYKSLISHMDNVCIFHSVQDMITDSHKGLWLFMWYCFLALAGENENKYFLTRRAALIQDDVRVDQKLITPLHRDHIINLLRLFFKLKLASEGEFADNVIRYIVDQKQMSTLLYSLALSLPPNEIIMKRAVNEIIRSTDFKDPVIEQSLQYISKAIKMVPSQILIGIVYIIISHNDSSNFTMNALKDLIGIAFQYLEANEKEIFADNLKKIIMFEYNKLNEEDNPIHYAFLISISYICSENEEKIDEIWQKFISSVVDPWLNNNDYDYEFHFDVNNINPSDFVISEYKE